MSRTAGQDIYRTITTVAVLLVAVIAATVSFIHIEALAIRYGQPELAAWLLPLSIDGTVAVASMAMLRSARTGLTTPRLARSMLLLAVGATLACNVGYGLSHGWPGALLSGWPAVAFVGSAEVAIGMSGRKKVQVRTAPSPAAVPADRKSTGRTAGAESAIRAALASKPGLSAAELAAQTGVSERTARRYRSRLTEGQAA